MLNCQPKVMTIYETAALIGGYTIEDPGKRGTLTATFSLNPGRGIDVRERPFWLSIQSWVMRDVEWDWQKKQ